MKFCLGRNGLVVTGTRSSLHCLEPLNPGLADDKVDINQETWQSGSDMIEHCALFDTFTSSAV